MIRRGWCWWLVPPQRTSSLGEVLGAGDPPGCLAGAAEPVGCSQGLGKPGFPSIVPHSFLSYFIAKTIWKFESHNFYKEVLITEVQLSQ